MEIATVYLSIGYVCCVDLGASGGWSVVTGCICLQWEVCSCLSWLKGWEHTEKSCVECVMFVMCTIVYLSDFSPDPWSPPECGPDESHRSQDALHPGVAVPAWVWNHSFPCQVSFITAKKKKKFNKLLMSLSLHILCAHSDNDSFIWVTHFNFKVNCLLCRFQGGKREELIGITYNRLIRMDASTGDAIKTWRFSNMKQWNVNWEIKMVGSPVISTILM